MAKTQKAPAPVVAKIEMLPEEIASLLAQELKPHFIAKRLADAEIKPLKEQLIQCIAENKDLFLPEGAKSCVIEGVLVTITTEAAYEYGENFDLLKFYKAYPNAVKFEFKTAEMKNINFEKYDLTEIRKPKNTAALLDILHTFSGSLKK